MYTLIQEGRWVRVSPTPSYAVQQLLLKELSYEKKGGEFMPNPLWAVVCLYQPKKCRFPLGLLHRVLELFTKNNIIFHIETFKFPLPKHEITDKTLRPYQLDAIRALIEARGGILSLPTGAGKTRLSCSYIASMELKTLVIVPTIEIKKQWEAQVPSGTTVMTYQSIKSKKFVQEFELIIFDECHITAAKTLFLIGMNASDSCILVGLSATPFMRDDDNLKVEAVLGRIVYSVSLRELIDKGFLVDAHVFFHSLSRFSNPFLSYHEVYDEYIVRNEERNSCIEKIVSSANGHVLVLVDKIEHGVLLEERIPGSRFIHGKSKNRDDIDYKVLIATSIYDMGVDLPHLSVLVLAGGGKSAIKVIQRMGRVLRLFGGKDKAVIHDFVDNARWLFVHYKERRKIMSECFEVFDV